jgi:putative DNA primase/helicase
MTRRTKTADTFAPGELGSLRSVSPTSPTLDNARVALRQCAAEVAINVLGQPNYALSSDPELRFGKRGSVAVKIKGPNAGLYYDHEKGEGGDLLCLIQRQFGGSFSDAARYVQKFIGLPSQQNEWTATSPRSSVSPALSEDARTNQALKLWRQAEPINNTEAAIYLEARGVLEPALEAGAGVLRFHPDCPFGKERHPCLLALMRHIESDEPRAIQRTALTQSLMRAISRTTFADFKNSGQRVARLALGLMSGTAIKLSHDEDVSEGLAIGEGTESVLAAMKLGFRPSWALAGTSGIKSFPVLSGIEALTILVDNDQNSAGQRAAQQCSERWSRAGLEVFRAIPNQTGDDFDDVLRWSVSV